MCFIFCPIELFQELSIIMYNVQRITLVHNIHNNFDSNISRPMVPFFYKLDPNKYLGAFKMTVTSSFFEKMQFSTKNVHTYRGDVLCIKVCTPSNR